MILNKKNIFVIIARKRVETGCSSKKREQSDDRMEEDQERRTGREGPGDGRDYDIEQDQEDEAGDTQESGFQEGHGHSQAEPHHPPPQEGQVLPHLHVPRQESISGHILYLFI